MSQKTVLITGCSSGIGYACAHALHQQNYHVIATCRKAADVSRLQAEGLCCIPLDLSAPKSITTAVQQVQELSAGTLYAIFSNAGYGQPGALEDLPTDALREQFETNFFGTHQLITELIPELRKQGNGRIILNSSVLGFAAIPYRGAYNASKFALEGWADTLRLELYQSGIYISLIEPGPIETRFRANALEKFRQWIDIDVSRHREEYQNQLARLNKAVSGNRFVLPAESVVAPLLHALESDSPKPRYRVTTQTKIAAILKRLLSTKAFDKVLRKSA